MLNRWFQTIINQKRNISFLFWRAKIAKAKLLIFLQHEKKLKPLNLEALSN
jgi:hypothetical protein